MSSTDELRIYIYVYYTNSQKILIYSRAEDETLQNFRRTDTTHVNTEFTNNSDDPSS